MKKLILFLLLPLWAMAQTSTGQEQEFDYGIKNNSTQTITTPPYLTTTGIDGTQGKIPSALVEKTDNKQNSLTVDGTGTKYPTVDAVNAALPKTYTTTVYVNTNDPNTATIFDDENPPTVNDNALKANTDNLYIGADASAWVYSGGEYVTKIVPASSNFNIYSTPIDAGNDKYSTIERFGEIVSKSGNIVRKDGSDSVGGGGYFSFYNNAITSGNTFQLNASNGVDLWNYSSGTWNKRFTFSSDGYLGINNNTPLRGLHIKSNTATGGLLVEHSDAFSGNIIEVKSNLNGASFRVDYGGAIYGGNGINITGDSSFQQVGLGTSPNLVYITGNEANGLLSYGAAGLDFKTISNNDALHIKQFGNVLINTPTDDGINQLQVNGSTITTALTLSTTPTTSSGTYDILTRNSTTGVIEKAPSSKYAFFDGSNASGDWGISITGSASHAANWGGKPADFSANVGKVANIAAYDSTLGYYRTSTKDQVNTFLSPYSGQIWGLLGDSFAVLNIYQPDLENRLGIFTISDGVSGSCITGGTNFAQGDAIDRPPFTQRIDAMLANTSSGIILEGGSNDFYYQVPLGTINDVVNTTFYGALKEILLKCVNKVSPNNVRLITPTIRDNTFVGGSGRSLFLNQLAYVNAMKEVAQMYGVICIDLFSGSGFTYENLDVLTSDGVHPNANGKLFFNNFLIANFDTTYANASAPLNSPALTGTPTAPTAPAGTNNLEIANTAFVHTAIGNYKKYVALLTQTSTSDPVPTILENTLGGTVVWTRTGTGAFLGTLTGVFTTDKTLVFITQTSGSSIVSASCSSVNAVSVSTANSTTANAIDGVLSNSSIEIRVYN